jgi:hypothetical protein
MIQQQQQQQTTAFLHTGKKGERGEWVSRCYMTFATHVRTVVNMVGSLPFYGSRRTIVECETPVAVARQDEGIKKSNSPSAAAFITCNNNNNNNNKYRYDDLRRSLLPAEIISAIDIHIICCH